jgi:hypothetical protein
VGAAPMLIIYIKQLPFSIRDPGYYTKISMANNNKNNNNNKSLNNSMKMYFA